MQVNDERLAHVGPRDPANGYPLWYEDAEGVRLALGLSRGEDPNLIPIDDVEPGDLVIPGNFPHEAFTGRPRQSWPSAATEWPAGRA